MGIFQSVGCLFRMSFFSLSFQRLIRMCRIGTAQKMIKACEGAFQSANDFPLSSIPPLPTLSRCCTPGPIWTLVNFPLVGQILNIPIYATTQKRAALGPTCAELGLDSHAKSQTAVHVDKSAFSMWVPEIQSALASGPHEVAVVGIESHICVTQTTLDLLAHGHKVYVLADGVSSCNREEVPVALRRLALAGAVITTSESFLYECMGDASITEFKVIAGLVKECKESTKETLQTLCKI